MERSRRGYARDPEGMALFSATETDLQQEHPTSASPLLHMSIHHRLILADIVAATGQLLLPAEDAARLLGYPSPNAFLEEIRRGKIALPYVKRGHKLMFTATGIAEFVNAADQAFIAQQRQEPSPCNETSSDAATQVGTTDYPSVEAERPWLRKIAAKMRSVTPTQQKTHRSRDAAA